MNIHSFAVLAYSDSPYLAACLESLKNQTVTSDIYISTSTPSEHIIALAKKYGVDLLITETGKGIAHDWNFSLQQAKTKYVTLAHQDDLYLPDYTASCISKAEQLKDNLICFTNYAEIVAELERSDTALLLIKRLLLWVNMPLKKNISSTSRKKVLCALGSPVATPSVMYNLENLSSFQFSPEFSVSIDWEAWYRMAGLKGRFVYLNQVLVQHRIHVNSATTFRLKENKRANEDLKMFKRYWPDFIARLLAWLYAKSYKSNDI